MTTKTIEQTAIDTVRILSIDAVQKANDLRENGQTVIFIAIDNILAGLISIADPIKSSTKEAIDNLHSLGINVVMLTGDNEITAKAVAKNLSIKQVYSDVLPEDKLSVIFITPDLNNKILEEEFKNLKTDKKIWIYWNSSLEDKNTVVRIIQSILVQEQNAEISDLATLNRT